MLRINRSYTPSARPSIILNDQRDSMQQLVASPVRKMSQKEQDEADEQARQKAKEDLVQSWMDRLQLISVITTFFASVEATMLQLTVSDVQKPSRVNQAANASFTGALIMHAFAAIISFLAAFFLIKYKLTEATREEIQAELKSQNPKNVKGSEDNQAPCPDVEKSAGGPMARSSSQKPVKISSFVEPPIWSTDPHLEQVGPFQRKPPTHLLRRFHSLCILFAFSGFVLALLGIMCFAWDTFTLGVSTFASVCFAFCFISSVFMIVCPS